MSENYHETQQIIITCEKEANRLSAQARTHSTGRELAVNRSVVKNLRKFAFEMRNLTSTLNQKSA